MARLLRILLMVLACLGSVQPVAGAATIDALIQGLAGDDEQARVEARQLLPRQSIEAVPKLLPLLAHENEAVWRVAFNVLADFANEVSVPGREADRAKVTAGLMTLVARKQPTHIKERGLRLLPLVIPEGYDVGPVAALLKDPELREKARAALQLTGTTEACAALRKALRYADVDLQCAVLNSLGELQDKDSIRTIRKLTRHREPRVRAAAARALARTGDPSHVRTLRSVRAAADAETLFEATDALLRLTDTIAARGGNWETVMGVYREVLRTTSNSAHQGAAIVGLGTHGDETVVEDILAALERENGRELEPAALAACQSLQGAAACKVLLDAYPRLSADMRLCTLGVFGRKRDPVFLDLLQETAASDDAPFRRAALEALAESQLPDALPTLVAAAQDSTGEDREAAVENLTRLANVFRSRGEKRAAGEAFLALYRLADTEDQCRYALEGIKQFPVPEAFEVVMETIDTADLSDLSVGALAGVAKALLDAGRTEDANQAVSALLARVTTTEAVAEAIRTLSAMGPATAWTHRLGFVTDWSLVGPFPWAMADGFQTTHVNEPTVDLTATYRIEDRELRWTRHTTQDPAGMVNLIDVFGQHSNVTAYGLAQVALPEQTAAVVRMGTDDGVKLWVNGEVVHENNVDRPALLDQDHAPVTLRAGKNTLLIQVTQGGGGWNFCLRLTRPDGTPLPFTADEQG